MSPRRFEGQSVVVTGATSGIGWSLAQAFGAEGARVTGTGRDQSRLMRLEHEVDLALTLDLTDSRGLPLVARTILDAQGGVDVLVHNAGIGSFAHWSDTTVAEMRRVMEANLFGAVNLTGELLPAMVEQGRGVIVVIASVAGRRGYPRHTAYCASKHALIGWARALRKDLRGTGVDVVVVCPPAVDTPFFINAGYDTFREDHPGLGLMAPETVAAATLDAVVARKQLVTVGRRAKVLHALEVGAPGLLDQLQLWRDRLARPRSKETST